MKHIARLLIALAAITSLAACKDRESYADLLRDENKAVNQFLSSYQVIDQIPADAAFTSVTDLQAKGYTTDEALKLAPYYRINDDGHLYMQVVDPGNNGEKVTDNQTIYFRFTRYNLTQLYKYGTWEGYGNAADLGTNTTSFRYANTQLQSTTQWGEGIQAPLQWLNTDCEVNIVIKSYLGPTEEVVSVNPYLYHIRYFPSRI